MKERTLPRVLTLSTNNKSMRSIRETCSQKKYVIYDEFTQIFDLYKTIESEMASCFCRLLILKGTYLDVCKH